jgi:hypothetical protein
MNNSPYSPKNTENKHTRREMFRGLVRYLLLGIMALVWALLSVRSARNSHAAPCAGSLSCSECPLIEKCDISQAAITRESDQRQ